MNKIPKPFIVVIGGTIRHTHYPQKKNKVIIQPSWPNKFGQLRIEIFFSYETNAGNPEQ